ncbi:aspartic peptidase domain-containing protein [Microdochium bolleyi]|uniref:Aspartic peptidase domain-containing protein n=1 Tax=Microdochium bolleyi TaxID=196109 RepID=A0A136JA72_9PEZI|nr:aspartic peptidase domain-containing protein [Microdochium bolleyi]
MRLLCIALGVLICTWEIFAAEDAALETPRVARLDVVRRPGTQAERLSGAGDGSRLALAQELLHNRTAQAYFATLQIGTPPQDIDLLIDTGSADLWVLDSGAVLCQKPGVCYDTYSPGSSSSFELVSNGGFQVTYIDNRTAKGDRVKDDVGVGRGANPVVLQDLEFGLAKESRINTGILGLGYGSSTDGQRSLLDKLKSMGQIGSRAYSLYLNDYTASTGTIIFGGVDTTKFIGPLNTIDVVPSQGQDVPRQFLVGLDAIVANFSASGGASQDLYNNSALPPPSAPMPSSASSLRVLLDSGTTISYLPTELVTSIWKYFGVRDDRKNTGVGLVDCTLATRSPGLTVDFHFHLGTGSATPPVGQRPVIRVPFREFILDNIKSNSNSNDDITLPPDLGFKEVCSFGLLDRPGGAGGLSILGQNFLRSAYVVYDLDHNKIGLAQANLNSTSTSTSSSGNGVIEITEDKGIPSVTGVAFQGAPPGGVGGGGVGGVGGGGGPTTSSNGGPQPTGKNGALGTRKGIADAEMVAAVMVFVSMWLFPALCF